MGNGIRLTVVTMLLVVAPVMLRAEESGIVVDSSKKSIRIPAKVAPRKLEHLKEVYPLEVIAGWGHPKGKKAHETVFTIEAKPSEVHQALEKLGLTPGKPHRGEGGPGTGPEIALFAEWKSDDGSVKRMGIDKLVVDPKTKKPLPRSVKFRFTGSALSQPDPTKPEKLYGADLSGTLIALFPVTDETVLQTNLTMKEEKYLKLDTNRMLLPAEGTSVTLILEVPGS
ncbi:YdjY domain-containing protein [Tuwongella immobilis]|uniref:Uncharacterized protein n=1 Tax=Tuwongella immobilis TaxID=692036 RepID=A0A6C2YM55_9BACT|nr:YdjY domain-containing protein [Tuwongella immobilis]VIP02670.1 Uncharacterized protein OS=Rhodopirellula baltica WH47 GN=RBWH47_04139 PE=4 SV=1 [Tuwongella immobilis]VTS02099.1 Uncharacterized protein OS=Rhodopirellula baltica WH47 GN=RBWH47_04139 PE=4 SV=1 [Tuwongella immobilis]